MKDHLKPRVLVRTITGEDIAVPFSEPTPFVIIYPTSITSHPQYWPLTVIALLLPPIGLLMGIYFSLHRDSPDRQLGHTLIGKALILPVILLFIWLLLLQFGHTPQGRYWR